MSHKTPECIPVLVPWGAIGRFREMLEKAEVTGHLLNLYD
jgi:hypothetical protein